MNMSDDTIFINRELSWLDFNRRVLALGKDKNVPLAERVKFLAIYGSNLDEFFMVRVGSLQERANLEQEKGKKEKRENKTNMTAAEQLAAIMPKTAQLQEDCDKYYAKALEALAENGYRKVDLDHLTKEDEHVWKKYFQTELFPILSPQIVDNRHPFPFLRSACCSRKSTLPGRAWASSPSPARWNASTSSKRTAKRCLPLPKNWCCTLQPASSARRPFWKNACSALPAMRIST